MGFVGSEKMHPVEGDSTEYDVSDINDTREGGEHDGMKPSHVFHCALRTPRLVLDMIFVIHSMTTRWRKFGSVERAFCFWDPRREGS